MGLNSCKTNPNFIQISIRMCVECAFGILKGRKRIIMKMIDVFMQHMNDIIATFAVLHNMCTISKN